MDAQTNKSQCNICTRKECKYKEAYHQYIDGLNNVPNPTEGMAEPYAYCTQITYSCQTDGGNAD